MQISLHLLSSDCNRATGCATPVFAAHAALLSSLAVIAKTAGRMPFVYACRVPAAEARGGARAGDAPQLIAQTTARGSRDSADRLATLFLARMSFS